MVSIHSEPQPNLLSLSRNVVSSLTYLGDEGIAVVSVKSIVAAISLPVQPLVTRASLDSLGYPASAPVIDALRYFVYEKAGEESQSFHDDLPHIPDEEDDV